LAVVGVYGEKAGTGLSHQRETATMGLDTPFSASPSVKKAIGSTGDWRGRRIPSSLSPRMREFRIHKVNSDLAEVIPKRTEATATTSMGLFGKPLSDSRNWGTETCYLDASSIRTGWS